MGWGYCGVNTDTGEEMGYSVIGACAEGGCTAEIDHGLAYLCGAMHEDRDSCNRYFCGRHLHVGFGRGRQLCRSCADECGWDYEEEDEDAHERPDTESAAADGAVR